MLHFNLKNVKKDNRNARVIVRAKRDNHSNRLEFYYDTKCGASHFRIDLARRLLRDAVPFIDHKHRSLWLQGSEDIISGPCHTKGFP